jgi:hypothetical protein
MLRYRYIACLAEPFVLSYVPKPTHRFDSLICFQDAEARTQLRLHVASSVIVITIVGVPNVRVC